MRNQNAGITEFMNLNLQFVNSIIDFIYPECCIVSQARLNNNNSNKYINDDEIESLKRVYETDIDDLKSKLMSDVSFSLFAFQENDSFSKILYHLKYGGMKKLGILLGQLLGKEVNKFFEDNNFTHFDHIVPVPLFKARLRERGYNQSEYICRGIGEILSIDVLCDAIIRKRHTKSQSKLSRSDRAENVRNAFELNNKYKDQIYHKKIILVDDVVTTGATLNEVIKVLRNNYCSKIMVCTLAMAR